MNKQRAEGQPGNRQQRWRLFGALSLALFASGCGDSTRVIVSVGQLPATSSQLIAQVRMDGAQYAASPSFPLTASDLSDGQRYSFGLTLRGKSSGMVAISVAALSPGSDGSNDSKCLLATATGSVTLDGGSVPTLNLELSGSPPACNSDLPIVHSVSPQLVDGAVRLMVEGFGFTPGAQVVLDGRAQDFVLSPSSLSLITDLPQLAPTPDTQAVQTAVRLPSGAASNSVVYRANPPWFELPTAPLYQATSGSGTPIYTGAVTGDFNGDKRQDLALSGYLYNNGTVGSGFVDIFLNSGHGLSAQRLTSPVWSDTASANPANVTANALVTSNYRNKPARDLIVAISDATQGRGGFIVLTNDGQGNFTPTATRLLDPAYPTTTALAHVDLNPTIDPGLHPDLALLSTLSDGSSKLSTFIADGGGNLTTTVYFDAGIGQRASGFAVADLNKDGSPDFAIIAANVSDPSHAQVHAILNYRDGKIFPSYADQTPTSNIAGFGGAVVAGDFMGDGTTYLVAGSNQLLTSPAASVSVLSNRTFLTTHPPHGYATPPNEPALLTLPQLYSAGAQPTSLTVIDADHDGVADVAAILSSSAAQPTRIVLLRSRHPPSDSSDLFAGGPGQLSSLPTLPLWSETSDALLLADDLNGDSFVDLIAVVRGDGPTQRPAAIWFYRSR